MELKLIRSFVTIAEEGHFGRAARRLKMAQPPLSRQIQKLEQELGFALLDRSRRSVELTPAGRVFLERSGHIFAAVDRAVREAQRASRGESGRLVIGYPSSLAYSGLTEILRAFRQAFPGVEVVLRESSPAEQVEALRSGDIDVGFIRAPLEDPALDSLLVREEPLVVALPADHPLVARERIPLARLAREPFVLFPRWRGPAYFDLLMRLCHEAGFTPRIVQEAPQLDIVSFVAAGFGVSLVPLSLRNMHRAGLVLRPLTGNPRTSLLAVWRRTEPSPLIEGFLAVVRQEAKRLTASAERLCKEGSSGPIEAPAGRRQRPRRTPARKPSSTRLA